MEKILVAIVLIATLSFPYEAVEVSKDGETYHDIYIMTFGSAHNFRVRGFHEGSWGRGNDSYVYISYYGPSLLPVKCRIWNESIGEWIDVRGKGLEMHNFSGWMIYLRDMILQPYIIFLYGKCDELTTYHIR